jgi:hypothetical protein
MGTIVPFAVRDRGTPTAAPRAGCEVTLFPGVRYERTIDPAPPPGRSPQPDPARRDDPPAG